VLRRIVEHLGSAYDKAELELLLEAGRQKIAAKHGQELLDLDSLKASICTHRPGEHHGRDQVLDPAMGGSAKGLHPHRIGGTPEVVIGFLIRWFWRF